jgi:hypothetical protein
MQVRTTTNPRDAMPDTRTKDADLAAIKARCELNYTVASHPKFAGNRIVMAAIANAKASEVAFLAAVAEADAARGFRIWGAYRHCRQACAVADSAHASLRGAIESAEKEYEVQSESLPDTEALTDDISRHFRGKPNTKAILEAKAEVATHFVVSNFDCPLEFATALAARDLGDKEAHQALAETAAFLLSLIDQSALSILGAENRNLFIDAVEAKVVGALKEKGVEPMALRRLLHKRYEEYAQYYPWLRDRSASEKFFREFGKLVGPTLGVDRDIAWDIMVENQVLSSLLNHKMIEILRLP